MRRSFNGPRAHRGARAERGATLLEVMVALAIMASAFVALLEAQIASIRNSTYGKQITVAAFLAQTKLEETEEKLLKEGFPLEDKQEQETFEKLGYPNFKWKLEISKVDLPLGAAVEQIITMMGGGGAGGDAAKKDAGSDVTRKLGDSLAGLGGGKLNLQDLTKNMPGLGGGAGSPLSMLGDPAMLKSSMDMLGKMLESSIRQIKLTVFWGEDEGDRMAVTTHVVTLPQAPGVPGAAQGGAGGLDPSQLPP